MRSDRKAARKLAAFEREYQKLLAAIEDRGLLESGSQARVVLECARGDRITFKPDAAVVVGVALCFGGRPLDGTHLLASNIAASSTPLRSLGRLLLVMAAEESGRYALAVREGTALIDDPATESGVLFDVLTFVAQAEAQVGTLEAGAAHLARAHDVAHLGDRDRLEPRLAWLDVLGGELAGSSGDLVTAERRLRRALASPALGHPVVLAHALLADVLIDRGDLVGAAHELELADRAEDAERGPAHQCTFEAFATLVEGRLRLAEGEPRAALVDFDHAEALLVELQRAPLVARVHRERVAALADLGRPDEAQALLVRTRGEYAYLGCERVVAEIDRQLGNGHPDPPGADVGGAVASADPADGTTGAVDRRAWGLGAWDSDAG